MTWKHITGAIVSIIVGLFLYGREIEEIIAPPIDSVTVDRVARAGSGLYWTVNFCKLRDLRLEQAEFVFLYKDAGGRAYTGHLIPVRNRSDGRPAGSSFRPPGCFEVDFATELPKDAKAGDMVIGEVFYPGLNDWWQISASFGEVVVP
jgi:hypothetical protein